MNRKADRIKRTHAAAESSQTFKGLQSRPFDRSPAPFEPSPLEHSLGKIALLPATAAPAPVFQAHPNRAEIVPDNQVPGMTIQAKLKIGAPADKYEQEADRVARTVMRGSTPARPPRPSRARRPAPRSAWESKTGS